MSTATASRFTFPVVDVASAVTGAVTFTEPVAMEHSRFANAVAALVFVLTTTV
jgi:hypothetical protein